MSSHRSAEPNGVGDVTAPGYRVPSPGHGLDISGRPLAKRVGTSSDARGRRLTDPMARLRNDATSFVPRPFALDTKPLRRIHPGALLSSIQLADFVVVLLVGAISLVVQPGLAWPLGVLPAATGGLVLALMTRSLEPGPRQPQELLRRGLSNLIADGAVHAL